MVSINTYYNKTNAFICVDKNNKENNSPSYDDIIKKTIETFKTLNRSSKIPKKFDENKCYKTLDFCLSNAKKLNIPFKLSKLERNEIPYSVTIIPTEENPIIIHAKAIIKGGNNIIKASSSHPDLIIRVPKPKLQQHFYIDENNAQHLMQIPSIARQDTIEFHKTFHGHPNLSIEYLCEGTRNKEPRTAYTYSIAERFQGDLIDYLNGPRAMTIEQTLSTMQQMGETLLFLHRRGWAWIDGKLENILYKWDNNTNCENNPFDFKFCDFDTVINVQRYRDNPHLYPCGKFEGLPQNYLSGTEEYLAPEAFNAEYMASMPKDLLYRVDIFALGVIFFALYYRCEFGIPWKNLGNEKFCTSSYAHPAIAYINNSIQFALQKHHLMGRIIMDMLDPDPRKRPSLQIIINTLKHITKQQSEKFQKYTSDHDVYRNKVGMPVLIKLGFLNNDECDETEMEISG